MESVTAVLCGDLMYFERHVSALTKSHHQALKKSLILRSLTHSALHVEVMETSAFGLCFKFRKCANKNKIIFLDILKTLYNIYVE